MCAIVVTDSLVHLIVPWLLKFKVVTRLYSWYSFIPKEFYDAIPSSWIWEKRNFVFLFALGYQSSWRSKVNNLISYRFGFYENGHCFVWEFYWTWLLIIAHRLVEFGVSTHSCPFSDLWQSIPGSKTLPRVLFLFTTCKHKNMSYMEKFYREFVGFVIC